MDFKKIDEITNISNTVMSHLKNIIIATCVSIKKNQQALLREKCPYSELFWSAFSHIRIEYREIQNISPYSVRMRTRITPNMDSFYAVCIFKLCNLCSGAFMILRAKTVFDCQFSTRKLTLKHWYISLVASDASPMFTQSVSFYIFHCHIIKEYRCLKKWFIK